jgi:hypothetical protein
LAASPQPLAQFAEKDKTMTTQLKMSSTALSSSAQSASPAPLRNPAIRDTEAAALHEVRNLMNELHTLLEDYAPAWYSEQHHNRTKLALRQLNRLQGLGPVLVR